MTLNSLDVQNKTFNPQFRGFSKHEVDEFLDIVVRDYDEFAQTIKDQERELKALRERVKYFDDMKDSLNKSIVVAQDAADNLREQAKSEADTLRINSEKESFILRKSYKSDFHLRIYFFRFLISSISTLCFPFLVKSKILNILIRPKPRTLIKSSRPTEKSFLSISR